MSQPLIAISRRQALFFATFLVLYEFLTYIANDMIMPGMLQVVQTFHGQETDIALSLMLYILGGASLQIFLGPLSDCYGRRPVMLWGAFIFFAFTAFIAFSSSMSEFLIARFFEGMGLCFIGVIGYSTLQEIFQEMEAVRLTAMMANVSILAPLLGPLAGAIVVHYASWRFIFIAISIGSIIAFYGLWWSMPESVGQIKRDGTLIPRVPWSLAIIFRNYQELFKHRSFLAASIAMGLSGLPCVAWIGLAPVIVVTVGHQSLMTYACWQLPLFGAIILGNLILRRWTHHYTLTYLIQIGSWIMGIGLAGVWFGVTWVNHTFLGLLPGLIVYFFGLGVLGSPLSRFVLFSTSVAKGTASALMSLVLMLVQSIGVQLANNLYENHSNQALSVAGLGVACVYGLLIYSALKVSSQTETVS